MLTISSANFTYSPEILVGISNGFPVTIHSNAGRNLYDCEKACIALNNENHIFEMYEIKKVPTIAVYG